MKNLWIGIIAVLLVAVGAYFYTNDSRNLNLSTVDQDGNIPSDTEYIDEEIDEAPDTGITADTILENPEVYEGMEVNLKAEVEEYISPRAFLLDAQGIVNDKLLVITSEPTIVFEDPEIFGDAIWEVDGTVERFQYEIAIDTIDPDLDPDIFAQYEGMPYVLADSVTLFED